jgi:hypothetical protein
VISRACNPGSVSGGHCPALMPATLQNDAGVVDAAMLAADYVKAG